MRTITKSIDVYKFDELSDEAKEKALQDYCNEVSYSWSNEAMNSLKKFIEHFNCELNDWSVDFLNPYQNSFRITYPDDLTEDEIKSLLDDLGVYDPETLKGIGECKLTGYCIDEDIIDGFRIAWMKGERELSKLIEAGISSWQKAVQADAEYQYSEEGFADTCEANDYEFDINGHLI